MKKLLLAAVGLVTILSLTACGDSLDAFEILERSQSTWEDAHSESFIMTADMEMHMDMGMISMTMPITMRMDVESLDRSRMEIEMSLMGIDEMHTLIYTRDGYQYTELTEMGQTTRTRLSVDSVSIDEMVAFMETNDLFDIAESWVESSSVVSTNDGYRLEFVYNMEGVLAFMSEGGMPLPGMDDFDDIMNLDDLDADNWAATMIMYVDNDYLPVSATMDMTMTFSVVEAGIAMEMVMDMTMEIIYTEVTVNFPAWLDEIEGSASGVSVAAADLVGTWEWDMGGYVYVFNADGTGKRGFVTDELDEFTWEILNGYHLYLELEWWSERWSLVLDNDMITITDLDFPTTVFSYIRTTDFDLDTEAAEDMAEIEADEEPIAGDLHELVGEWAWMGTPWLRFYEDGRATDLSNSTAFRWHEDGTFSGTMLQESWEIRNGELTVTWVGGLSYIYTRINN